MFEPKATAPHLDSTTSRPSAKPLNFCCHRERTLGALDSITRSIALGWATRRRVKAAHRA